MSPLSVVQSEQVLALQAMAKQYQQNSISDYFNNKDRFEQFSLNCGNLFVDYSKQNVDEVVLQRLNAWAEEIGLKRAITSMFAGDKINHTEARAVLHTVLRAPKEIQATILTPTECAEIDQANKQMQSLCSRLHKGEYLGATGKAITDVIAIGIGGSYYGGKVAQEALKPFHQRTVKVHYLANIDGGAIAEKLAMLNPETTLVLIISKTFSTQETLLNAQSAKSWIESYLPNYDITNHFVAVSSNVEKALSFGIKSENILPMWDWVGGRFSLWSAVGLPLAIAIGYENFQQLKSGAYEMDQHFQSAQFSDNMPIIMALIGIWNASFLGHKSLAILPYDHSLRALPGYLQQVDMESNGKRVDHAGDEIALATAPIVFGQEGTNGQHAFMQLMHQSNDIVPADFIVSLTSNSDYHHHHTMLVANCFAQSEALMVGKPLAQAKQELTAQGIENEDVERIAPHKVMPGNSPSNTLVIESLTPKTLGSLLALYEHKIFVQGIMWQLNSFDQWGVELGKELGTSILAVMGGEDNDSLSSSTQGLIDKYLMKRS
ncbi:glucose-6-phosphate isomerase [Thalassotalea sp. ND16A]|uniref:glucose-6-phosphate isomerase n=1 Tax=Thalassotalea sp. ND16A TaxID=1535422 RepID=UPI00051D04BF|nr:glucose-6-phosphate isomerase [Thalassotalea sp. ND16A]KGK00731.1 Glucose-6-phosphate isomerase [Thalassotalea sp. ND16A]